MHYVSPYNYFQSVDRLAPSSGGRPDFNQALAGLSRFSVRDIMNDDEIMKMYKHRCTLEVIKRWYERGDQFDGEGIHRELRKQERFFVPKYVLKVNTPRYHSNQYCDLLKRNFENFETPPEIAALGPAKIREFKTFCDKEWPRYKDKAHDIFWAHVGARFHVSIAPKAVAYSAQDDATEVLDQSVEEIEDKIKEVAESLRHHARSTGLSQNLYAPPRLLYSFSKSPNQTDARRQAFAEMLNLKKLIKTLVFNFNRVELDLPEGLLSDEILEALGFLPCRACCRSAGR